MHHRSHELIGMVCSLLLLCAPPLLLLRFLWGRRSRSSSSQPRRTTRTPATSASTATGRPSPPPRELESSLSSDLLWNLLSSPTTPPSSQRPRLNKHACGFGRSRVTVCPTPATRSGETALRIMNESGGSRLTTAIPTENTYCSCKLTRVRHQPVVDDESPLPPRCLTCQQH